MTRLKFNALVPDQARNAKVAFFVSTAAEIAKIAKIDRLARTVDGTPSGFQRPQIAGHIREIGDYLLREDAILANPIVLGFVDRASIKKTNTGHELTIDITAGAPGWVVDGQQRFSALREINRPDFQVPVSAFICETEEELRRQFILINNTRPLPKGLIYELLPSVGGLPHRYQSRAEAASLVESLNYRRGSSLRGMIHGQTNPHGIIRDTIVQRVLMNSLSDGALRLYSDDSKLLHTKGVDLISEFFHAVKHVFHDAWNDHTPKTSRLVHGVGIISMGFVMEYLHAATGATKREHFIEPLTALRPVTAWTEGEWEFGPERRRWNSLQNVSSDWKMLAFYMVRNAQRVVEGSRPANSNVRG
ncbi:DGQHR domain-containing protein DpdB [Dyella japonica]|uniref:DGQHR domain-containing protein n=1 Tax=Dyella japonica TaxID=231455 RepID=A0ABV2JWA2_9GAMM